MENPNFNDNNSTSIESYISFAPSTLNFLNEQKNIISESETITEDKINEIPIEIINAVDSVMGIIHSLSGLNSYQRAILLAKYKNDKKKQCLINMLYMMPGLFSDIDNLSNIMIEDIINEDIIDAHNDEL